jgi:hypothetical protein
VSVDGVQPAAIKMPRSEFAGQRRLALRPSRLARIKLIVGVHFRVQPTLLGSDGVGSRPAEQSLSPTRVRDISVDGIPEV